VEKESPYFVQFSEGEIRRTDACLEFSRLLETMKAVPVGTSRPLRNKETLLTEKYGAPTPENIRGFERAGGLVYPEIAQVVRRLNREGIITRQQLANENLEKYKSRRGFGPKMFYISILLQNICKTTD
jgi:ATP-dependent RNA circularization protein (DNA/RNA ligase family)